METKCEHLTLKTSGQKDRQGEHGNALIYVLIAIALFAALSFTLARQTDSSEADSMSDDRAELYASQLISYASQAKSAVDQMLFQGARIDDLDFILPSETGFDTAPNIYKVYHPDGGGLNLGRLNEQAQDEFSATTPSGWYMGRVNNVTWTPSASNDVILTAHQIDRAICENINEKVTGNNSIPSLTGSISNYLVDTSTNDELTATICPLCDDQYSLCVQNSAGTAYSFYTIIADQ